MLPNKHQLSIPLIICSISNIIIKLPIDAKVLSHEVSEDDGNGLDLEIILKELLLSREKTFKSAAGNIDS